VEPLAAGAPATPPPSSEPAAAELATLLLPSMHTGAEVVETPT
jgi:hypothetical protein